LLLLLGAQRQLVRYGTRQLLEGLGVGLRHRRVLVVDGESPIGLEILRPNGTQASAGTGIGGGTLPEVGRQLEATATSSSQIKINKKKTSWKPINKNRIK